MMYIIRHYARLNIFGKESFSVEMLHNLAVIGGQRQSCN